jgi:hypothetical protein
MEYRDAVVAYYSPNAYCVNITNIESTNQQVFKHPRQFETKENFYVFDTYWLSKNGDKAISWNTKNIYIQHNLIAIKGKKFEVEQDVVHCACITKKDDILVIESTGNTLRVSRYKKNKTTLVLGSTRQLIASGRVYNVGDIELIGFYNENYIVFKKFDLALNNWTLCLLDINKQTEIAIKTFHARSAYNLEIGGAYNLEIGVTEKLSGVFVSKEKIAIAYLKTEFYEFNNVNGLYDFYQKFIIDSIDIVVLENGNVSSSINAEKRKEIVKTERGFHEYALSVITNVTIDFVCPSTITVLHTYAQVLPNNEVSYHPSDWHTYYNNQEVDAGNINASRGYCSNGKTAIVSYYNVAFFISLSKNTCEKVSGYFNNLSLSNA